MGRRQDEPGRGVVVVAVGGSASAGAAKGLGGAPAARCPGHGRPAEESGRGMPVRGHPRGEGPRLRERRSEVAAAVRVLSEEEAERGERPPGSAAERGGAERGGAEVGLHVKGRAPHRGESAARRSCGNGKGEQGEPGTAAAGEGGERGKGPEDKRLAA